MLLFCGSYSRLQQADCPAVPPSKLIPCQGTLPFSENPNVTPSLNYAVTDCGAVSYPEGHPSEDMALPQRSQSSSPSAFASTQKRTVKDADDDILRHFASLGFVVWESEKHKGTWEKTRNLLAMHMGDKRASH